MGRAVEDLQEKYASGKGGSDESQDGPTGAAYQQQEQLKRQMRRQQKEDEQRRVGALDEQQRRHAEELYYADEDNDADEDAELRRLREKRLRELQSQQRQKQEDVGKGHGQYRNIVQDEFLKEVTSSMYTVCHFYHNDFEKCKVMDHHLEILAKRHVETKFVRMDAAKSPFFVQKLAIRTMPTLIFFVDGVAQDKLIGFEGLADDLPIYHEDEWKTIKLARLLAKAGMIKKENIVDDDEEAAQVEMTMEEMRKQSFIGFTDDDIDLDDLSD